MDNDSVRDAATSRVYALGEGLRFAATGITDARPSEHAEHIHRWLADGKHAEMAYLQNNLPIRLDPCLLLEGAKSIICVADWYESKGPRGQGVRGPSDEIESVGRGIRSTPAAYPDGSGIAASSRSAPGPPDPSPPPTRPPRGRIARYAWGDDYHKVIKKRLHILADTLSQEFPGYAFRTAVDTAPTLEREHATRAGLGWQAKNTMLIHPRLGSYLLLGQIVTTLDLAPSRDDDWPGLTVPPEDHCGTCTRCIDACPTRCIDPAGYAIDASRCISYLTLEHRSAIGSEFHQAMRDWVAGCDVCQEVCPHNRKTQSQPAPAEAASEAASSAEHNPYTPRPEWSDGPPLLALLGWTEDDRRTAFRGSALKRIRLDMMKRNALIAAGNTLQQGNDPRLRHRIEQLAADPTEAPLVQHTARQVLEAIPF